MLCACKKSKASYFQEDTLQKQQKLITSYVHFIHTQVPTSRVLHNWSVFPGEGGSSLLLQQPRTWLHNCREVGCKPRFKDCSMPTISYKRQFRFYRSVLLYSTEIITEKITQNWLRELGNFRAVQISLKPFPTYSCLSNFRALPPPPQRERERERDYN